MAEDFDAYWTALGRPTKFQKAVAKVKEKLAAATTQESCMKFLEFIFTWIGRAWAGFWDPERWLLYMIVGFITTALTLGTFGIIHGARATCRVEYCYIKHYSDKFTLTGYRAWCDNIDMFEDPKFEAVLQASKEIGCPLK